MSVALMTLAFKTSLPATRKLVLLALCDAANDQGECYPSVTHLVDKCSLGERTIQEAIGALESSGIVRREFRTGRATVYWISFESSQPPQQPHPRSSRTPARGAPTPAAAAPPPPQQPHPTPAAAAPRTIIEPSIEPLPNRRPPAIADVSADVLSDWTALRKAKKAPVTATAVNAIRREAVKAGLTLQQVLELCCQRGWTGFRADWVADGKPNSGPAVSVAQTNEALAQQREAAARATKPPEFVKALVRGVRA